jgi:hypothetical protein
MHDFLIGNNQIDKHLKYLSKYGVNEIYWGIGIENETYLEFDKKIIINKDFFLNNHKSERYSVDYFSNYNRSSDSNNNYLNEALLFYINNYLKNKDNNLRIIMPFLINSHTFLKTDKNNNHQTLYTKKSEDNPNFNGKILLDEIIEDNEYLKKSMNYEWLFDGDTVEFTTNNFYNGNLIDVISQLNEYKTNFIENLNNVFISKNIYQKYGVIKLMEENYPFAIHLTNSNNISMFNNGTLHYNITLPSKLDENGKIKNIVKFRDDHYKAIKLIQWIEPFILAVYGAPDPFALMEKFNHKDKFSKSSQRCAISRYIGIGTYNCEKMEPGKILLKKISELESSQHDYWWYNEYYKNNAYTKLDQLGLDINFNKHFNHGIELRFFDHIADQEGLYKSFEFIIYLMDYILSIKTDKIHKFKCASDSKIWNKLVVNILRYGKTYELNAMEKKIYENIFDMKINKSSIEDIYNEIYLHLMKKFSIFCLNISDKEVIDDSKKYILIPNGEFSSLTLKMQYFKNNIFSLKKEEENDIFKQQLLKFIPKLEHENNNNNQLAIIDSIEESSDFIYNKNISFESPSNKFLNLLGSNDKTKPKCCIIS